MSKRQPRVWDGNAAASSTYQPVSKLKTYENSLQLTANRGNLFLDRRPSIISRNSTRITTTSQGPQSLQSNQTSTARHPKEFTPGTIIRAFVYEEAYARGSVASQASLIAIPGRDPLCAKFRYMIIVAQHHRNYTCIPLYTHNGMGLQNKEQPDEYVSVQDHRLPSGITFFPQSIHKPLVTAVMNSESRIKETSTAWLTYPISRSYAQPAVIEGHLDESSIEQLLNLYNRYIPKKLSGVRQGGQLRESRIMTSDELAARGLQQLKINERASFMSGKSRSFAAAAR